MNTTLRYTTTVADDRHANALTVTANGQARWFLGSNRDQRNQGVGFFEAALDPPLLQRLMATAQSPDLASSPSQVSLLPDEAYRRIELKQNEAPLLDKLVGSQITAPAAFVLAETVLSEAIARATGVPQQVLALRLSPPVSTVHAGARLRLELVLLNAGKTPLRMAGPPQWGEQAVAATVQLLRDDVATAMLRPADQHFMPLAAAQFVAAEPALRNAQLRLAPGERVQLRFELNLGLPVGRYRMEVNLETGVQDDNGQPLFDAGLFTPPVLINVQRR